MTRLTISTLQLSHFRSYVQARLETGGRSVALYGPNGAGKTNLLEAVSLLAPGRGLRRAGAEELIRTPERIGWRLRAEVETSDATVEIVTGAEDPGNPRRTVEIDGKSATQTRLGTLLRMVWLTPAMDRLWTEGATGRRQFLDRMALGFQPAHGEAAIAYERAMRDRNRLLREPGYDPAWIAGLEAQMARSGARLARSRAEALERLKAAQNGALPGAETLFPKADLAILGAMEERFGQVIRDGQDLESTEVEEAAGLAQALADGRARDTAAGRALTGPHRSDLEAIYAAKGMPARQCSTGEQKALLISLCLANARALAAESGAAPVLLFDEVAAHLDQDRRRALYGEIAALGAQAWMTATGPELFEGMEGAMQVSVTESGGRSALSEAA